MIAFPQPVDIIPAKLRRAIYVALGTLTALEAIWDVVPDALEGKIGASFVALGFVLAAGHTAK